MSARNDFIAVSIILAIVPQVPHLAFPERADSQEVRTVPFYTSFTTEALDRFQRMYDRQGKSVGVATCIGNAQVEPYSDTLTYAEAINNWHYAAWSLDRCVSRYYDQPQRSWSQFLATRPFKRYMEAR